MAKISDLLAAGPTYSFEFPPPRTPEMLRHLEKSLEELKPLAPSFCSVTYGAGGSTREGTLEAVLHIHDAGHLTVMPHLTCAGQTRPEIVALIERYRDEGLENILALAGDPPLDPSAPAGDFTFAVELIALVKELAPEFSICVAAFPEVHPRSASRESDRRFLAEKLAMADLAITQFFWDADHYFRMMDDLDALGVTTPVVPSVFPIINVATAKRFTSINGADWPAWLDERITAHEADADAVQRIGVEIASEIGRRLLDAGVPGLHIYTMNRSSSAQQVWANLDLSARR